MKLDATKKYFVTQAFVLAFVSTLFFKLLDGFISYQLSEYYLSAHLESESLVRGLWGFMGALVLSPLKIASYASIILWVSFILIFSKLSIFLVNKFFDLEKVKSESWNIYIKKAAKHSTLGFMALIGLGLSSFFMPHDLYQLLGVYDLTNTFVTYGIENTLHSYIFSIPIAALAHYFLVKKLLRKKDDKKKKRKLRDFLKQNKFTKFSSLLCLIGLLIIASTLFFDIIVVNIPPQDAPVHITEKYQEKVELADKIGSTGMFLFGLGFGLTLLSFVFSGIKKAATLIRS